MIKKRYCCPSPGGLRALPGEGFGEKESRSPWRFHVPETARGKLLRYRHSDCEKGKMIHKGPKRVEGEDAEDSWNPKTMREAKPGLLKGGRQHLSIHRSLHMASLAFSWLMEEISVPESPSPVS